MKIGINYIKIKEPTLGNIHGVHWQVEGKIDINVCDSFDRNTGSLKCPTQPNMAMRQLTLLWDTWLGYLLHCYTNTNGQVEGTSNKANCYLYT